jgi:hypothetical protein
MKKLLLSTIFNLIALSLFAQNVGINTAKPYRSLSVNGSIVVDLNSSNFGTLDSASIVFGELPVKVGISSNKNILEENPNGLDIWTNNLKRFSIAPNGNVGIGIANPFSKFQIISGSDVSLSNHGHMVLGPVAGVNLAFDNNEIQARNNGIASLLYMQANGGRLQLGNIQEGNILFDGANIQSYHNGSSDELVLNGINGGKIRLGGNLDFATTKLHISSGVEAGVGIANSGYMMIGPSAGENLVFDNNEILARNNGLASTLYLARDGSTVQLGNGTTVAGTKLHVSTGSDVGLSDAQSGHLMLGTQAATNLILDQNEIQARNNGVSSPLFLQSSGGNVALGAISPTTQLHMTGDFTMQSSNPIIQLKNAAATNIGFMQTINDDMQLGTNSGNATGTLILRTNGGNRLYVNPTGQVSIGTSVPAVGYLLSVNGRAMVEELKVQLSQNWPDYVFADNYKRKSFEELRNYIAVNKHLPNIPAASELEKNGVELGDMQRRMMEKIEELTLYVLDLEQKVNQLKKSE